MSAPDKSWPRRHPWTTLLLTFVVLLAAAVSAYAIHLNDRLKEVPTFPVDPGPSRPAATDTGGLNFLLAGVDDPQQQLEDALQAPEWEPGRFRSDTIMVVHINPDRRAAQVVSIPRDSYVEVPGHGTTKINAAFSYGGPSLFVRTVERLTDLRIDHVMVVDFDGLSSVTDALGGVEITVTSPERKPDGSLWTTGSHLMDGEEALSYVRQRKSLPGGDFDRVQRQQNYLRAMLEKVEELGLFSNPVTLSRTVESLDAALARDEAMTPKVMRSLAWSLRDLEGDDIRWATAPNNGSATIDGASVVLLDVPQVRRLFRAAKRDHLGAWLRNHPEVARELPPPDEVR